MRRVLVLNHFAKAPDQPGGNRHVDLFSRLEQWDVRIIAADRNNMSDERQRSAPGAPITYIPTFGGRSTLARVAGWVSYAAGAVLAGIAGRRPHAVYASSPHLLTALAGYLIALWWRVPWVFEIRDIWPRILVEMGGMSESSPLYRLLRRLEHFLYTRADRVVYLAAGNRDYLIGEGVPESRLTFIPNSVAPTTPRLARDEARSRFDFRGVVAAYTGAHGLANGLELLLDASEDLAEHFPELMIVMMGDGSEKPRLVENAQRRGLTNVRFDPPIAKRELPDFYAGVDVGVHVLRDVELFRHGVSPNKVVDYFAAGLPVVTNSPGEVGDLVERAQAGVVTSPDGLSKGLRELLAMQPGERSKLGRNGRVFAETHRNPDLMASELQRTLDEIC